MRTKVLLSTALALAVASPSVAQLIAADGFNAADYEVTVFPGVDQPLGSTGPIGNGNPIVDPGWVNDGDGDPSPWNQGTANLIWDTDATNPTLGAAAVTYDDDSTGKGTLVPIADGGFGVTFRASDRTLDPYTSSSTLYMSMLLNPGGAFAPSSTSRDRAMAGFVNSQWTADGLNNLDTALNPFGLMIGYRGETAATPAATDQVDLVLRARDTADAGGGFFPLEDNALLTGVDGSLDNLTHHVLLRVDINVDAGITDQVTYWVDPTDVTSEATATATAVSTGTVDTLAFNTIDDIDRFRIVVNSWENRSFFFDEPRLALDFESLRGELPVSDFLLGDADGDGDVDGDDLIAVQTQFGDTGAMPLLGDADNDGDVDGDDLIAVQTEFGNTLTAVAVPEPTSVAVLLTVALGIAARRR